MGEETCTESERKRQREGVRIARARESENASESERDSESAGEGKQDSESENESMRARERIKRGGGGWRGGGREKEKKKKGEEGGGGFDERVVKRETDVQNIRASDVRAGVFRGYAGWPKTAGSLSYRETVSFCRSPVIRGLFPHFCRSCRSVSAN